MWTSDISSIVFTRVKVQFSSTINTKYPDLYFTNSDKTQTTSKFPTVYVHEVGSIEQGQDIDNTGINAVLSTFQIDVIDSQSQERANEVMGEVVRIMKGMRFSITAMPEFKNTDSDYRSVARFRRMIGAGDTL
uniref:DUF3168 domain-containing protein n=1 Tax=Dulem virus 39 TaxID=3145757 RepID=A0AAU8B7M1_9CAUD